jgi:Flp pilus assembly protein TadG
MKSSPETVSSAVQSRVGALLRRLLRSEIGSVSIEFVIIVPVMLMMLLGFSEIYMYMRAVSLVEHTAFTLADSLGQMQSVVYDNTDTADSNGLGSIWNAAALLATPYNMRTNGMVWITSVRDSNVACPLNSMPKSLPHPTMAPGVAKINWQINAPWSTSSLSAVASQVTATNMLPATWPFRNGDSVTIVEVFYSYNPFTMTASFWPNAPGLQTIYRRIYVRQREGAPLGPCLH